MTTFEIKLYMYISLSNSLLMTKWIFFLPKKLSFTADGKAVHPAKMKKEQNKNGYVRLW
jgi:hypothetical protein